MAFLEQYIPNGAPLIRGPESAENKIIFLHGLGSSGLGFAQVADYLLNRLPEGAYQFILPTAPIRYVHWAGDEVTGWYDILENDLLVNQDEDGILQSSHYVHSLINDLIADGAQSENIFVGGFSQGGALSLLSALSFNRPLAGAFCLSSYLPIEQKYLTYTNPANKSLPIFFGQGEADTVVLLSQAQHSIEILKKAGHNVDSVFYPLGHEVSARELDQLALWIKK